MKKYKRTTILRANKHQKRFFYPVIVAFILGCVVSWLTLVYFLVGIYLVDPIYVQMKESIPIFLVITTFLMFIVLFWTFRISNRYFGPYDRLIDDLDRIIEGERKGPLTTRDNDIIFSELVSRINTLISNKK